MDSQDYEGTRCRRPWSGTRHGSAGGQPVQVAFHNGVPLYRAAGDRARGHSHNGPGVSAGRPVQRAKSPATLQTGAQINVPLFINTETTKGGFATVATWAGPCLTMSDRKPVCGRHQARKRAVALSLIAEVRGISAAEVVDTCALAEAKPDIARLHPYTAAVARGVANTPPTRRPDRASAGWTLDRLPWIAPFCASRVWELPTRRMCRSRWSPIVQLAKRAVDRRLAGLCQRAGPGHTARYARAWGVMTRLELCVVVAPSWLRRWCLAVRRHGAVTILSPGNAFRFTPGASALPPVT